MIHIRVKPLATIEHLIKIFSKEKSIILYPFMGSRTAGICCQKKNLLNNIIICHIISIHFYNIVFVYYINTDIIQFHKYYQ